MDIKDLKTLVKTVTETDITEFMIESGNEKITIKRGHCVVAAPQPVLHSMMPPPALQQQPAAPVPAVTAPAPAAAGQEKEKEKGEAICSPIVGTFYKAPAPDAAPYVTVGQIVEKGAVLCIVEAMKLMNEIEAEFRCKIVSICKENSQPVEYGDHLFLVERLG